MDTQVKISLCVGAVIFTAAAAGGLYSSISTAGTNRVVERPAHWVEMNENAFSSQNPPLSTQKRRFGYITGAVQNPGMYAISDEARVYDLVEAAGGLHPDADLSRLNMVAPIKDGAHIDIKKLSFSTHSPQNKKRRESTGKKLERSKYRNQYRYVYINTADADEISELPGIGPSLAQRIVDYRLRHGAFASPDSLLNVSGIGKAKLDKIRSLLRF